ncbi:MAG TPA: carboxypeptidase regulatory-like domain-containing protein, partial [Gemmatimonadales bacterium]|nr:carboxypeptidase regulatory-like domain-containing protein [Gemmatimonadales bacterium]
MKRLVWSIGAFAAVLLSLAARVAAAQGVTSAAIAGRVTDESNAPVVGAEVTVTNPSTGSRAARRTDADGRYFFENLAPGGPYTVAVHALGFGPQKIDNMTLALNQRATIDFSLKRAAVELATVTVETQANPLISTARTGPATFLSAQALSRLPNITRNFTDLIQTSPLAGTAQSSSSVGGQNNRFNNIQIDGGVNNDVFGLASSGTPGGQANAHPISIEAIKEYQIQIAPFDVRQGSFTGGLVNGVTKSGTNQFHGSVFGYYQNQDLVGTDTVGHKVTHFYTDQYGFSVGGPIIRDRVQFFASGDWQQRGLPFSSQFLIKPDTAGGQDSIGVGIRASRADSVINILKTQYGFDAGGFGAPTLGNPDKNLFAKASVHLGTNSDLEVSHNYVNATAGNLTRSPIFGTQFRDGYQLSNSGWGQHNTTNTTRAVWKALLFERFSNELLVGRNAIRDKRDLPNVVPLLLVNGNRPGDTSSVRPVTVLAAGSDKFSQNNFLNQDIYEVTDNVTWGSGTHTITVGTHNEFYKFSNGFFPGSFGVWAFTSPAQLAAGHAYHYEIALPADTILRPQGAIANFNVQQIGGYIQDVWPATPKLRITAGLRVDVPYMDHPVHNPAFDTIPALPINTSNTPSGNALWSPRLGFNYDVKGDASTIVRGGIGVFSGRPPYVWISNAFVNTGLEQFTLSCDGALVPPAAQFTLDVSKQPKLCFNQTSANTNAVRTVNYFDPSFKFPSDLKISLGADKKLPWDVVGTFDFLYTKALEQFYLTDVNLKGIQGTSVGEGGRPLYGTINAANGRSTAARINPSFSQIIEHTNESKDRSFFVTGQLQKSFSRVSFNVGYTYSHTEDLISLTSSIASSNLNFGALDGTLANRALRTSVFDTPNKITASGTINLPYGFDFSLVYIGYSGMPFSYVVSNDANADGISGNDMIYVPRNRSDITLADTTTANWNKLNSFISGEDCLNNNRGRLLQRNSCRNPWQDYLNARIVKAFQTINGQSVELSIDVFNILNLLNDTWGRITQTAQFEEQPMLTQTGYDVVNQRGIYS